MPSSSISIVVSVCSWRLLIILPPGPMTLPMNSGSISTEISFGAYWLISALGSLMAWFMVSRIFKRAVLARPKAFDHDVMGQAFGLDIELDGRDAFGVEPATLKSISPKWSSSPMMSVINSWRPFPSLIIPTRCLPRLLIDGHAGIHQSQRTTTNRSH